MKINTAIKKYAIGLAFALGVLLSGPASAATFSPCVGIGYDISDNVTGAANCTRSVDFDQDNVNPPLVVNTSPGFFNITNWMFGGKIGITTDYDGDGSGQSGDWDISDAFSNWQNIMLVFKSGNDNSGVSLVAYLLNQGALSGSWLTPFLDPPFNLPGNSTNKDVSHISVYYTECPPGRSCSIPVGEVPLPAGILLLISALGGLGFLTRFRKGGAAA